MNTITIVHEDGTEETRPFTDAEESAFQTQQLEFAWLDLRRHRDNLLASSDWTVLADTPTNTAAWKAYRQALRDLPANTTDPFNPVWPTPPA